MKGVDDGPDGLNEDAFDRALRRLPGVKRVSRRGKARVIRTGPSTARTQTIPPYDAEAVSTAWIAELRARGGGL
jgi:hypothetical protein